MTATQAIVMRGPRDLSVAPLGLRAPEADEVVGFGEVHVVARSVEDPADEARPCGHSDGVDISQ